MFYNAIRSWFEQCAAQDVSGQKYETCLYHVNHLRKQMFNATTLKKFPREFDKNYHIKKLGEEMNAPLSDIRSSIDAYRDTLDAIKEGGVPQTCYTIGGKKYCLKDGYLDTIDL